jgi:hypothetical protein
MRPLGKVQAAVLRNLREHGRWSRGCGWLWDTHSNTARILDGLVARGLATTRQAMTVSGRDGVTIYEPTEETKA